MVALNGTYQADPNAVSSFTPVPPGMYQVMLVNSKMNSKGTGISCEFDIVSGEFQGRKLFMNLSIFAENRTAAEIGQRYLNEMCVATGKLAISDTSELHGITMQAKVKLRKDDPTQNDITGFAPLDGAAPAQTVTQAQAPAQPAAQQAATPSNAPPWKR